MIDLGIEKTLSLAQAAKLLPAGRNGKRVHLSTLLRWVLDGAKSPTGDVVKLEALRLGGRWVTSIEKLQDFAARLTPITEAEPAPAPRTASARRRASERARRALEKVGI